MRWLFTAAIAFFTLASIGCAASGSFAMLVSFRVVQGIRGRNADSDGVCRSIHLVPAAHAGHLQRQLPESWQCFAPTVGPVVGGWDYADVFLALAVSDQRRSGLIAASHAVSLASEKYEFRRRKLDGLSLFLMAAALACLEIGLSSRRKMDVLLHLHKLVFS